MSVLGDEISIHSLVKRETITSAYTAVHLDVHFNPLPRKEGDKGVMYMKFRKTNFNPLPRKEGDLL